MSGLIAKKASLFAHWNNAHTNVQRRVRSLFFLATPHDIYNATAYLHSILQISRAGMPSCWGSQNRSRHILQFMNDKFRHYLFLRSFSLFILRNPETELWRWHYQQIVRESRVHCIKIQGREAFSFDWRPSLSLEKRFRKGRKPPNS